MPKVGQAIEELLAPLDARVTTGAVDLALLFATPHFDDDLAEVVDRVAAKLPGAVLLGCTAEGTIGVDRELERVPSLSLLAASLPDVLIRPFHIRQNQLEAAETALDWERIVGVAAESTLGVGSVFSVTIPVCFVPAQRPARGEDDVKRSTREDRTHGWSGTHDG